MHQRVATYPKHQRSELDKDEIASGRKVHADLYAYDRNVDFWRDEDDVDERRMVLGWWIIPAAALGAAIWYLIFRGIWALIG